MRRELTITMADDVYCGLRHRVGRDEISRFIEHLVRPHVLTDDDLEAQFREAALDIQAEKEARKWIESIQET